MAKNLLLWVVIAVVLMSVFNNFTATKTAPFFMRQMQGGAGVVGPCPSARVERHA
jgi:hypothetical protein